MLICLLNDSDLAPGRGGRQTGRYERTAGCSPGNTEHGKAFLNQRPAGPSSSFSQTKRGRERREGKRLKKRLGICDGEFERRGDRQRKK